MDIRLKNVEIRPNLRFYGLSYSGKDALSTKGGSLKSRLRKNHCFHVYLGSITGSERTTRLLIKKLGTFSGSVIFTKCYSIISQSTYLQLYFLPIIKYQSNLLSSLSFIKGYRMQAISYRPCNMAYYNVLNPSLSMQLGSAPLDSRYLTIYMWFFLIAEIIGVSPLGDGRLGSALYFQMRSWASSRLPVTATCPRAVTLETAVRGSFIRLGLFSRIYQTIFLFLALMQQYKYSLYVYMFAIVFAAPILSCCLL